MATSTTDGASRAQRTKNRSTRNTNCLQKAKATVEVRAGKQDLSDTTAVEDDDEVEEYDFSTEADQGETIDDACSVISLSSEQEPAAEDCPMDPRPWKGMSGHTRMTWETMYASVTPFAIAGSWTKTEEYQQHKDEEMLLYLQDFPIETWTIPKEHASKAYDQLVERMRWRNHGILIYGRDQVLPPPPPPSRGSRPLPPGPGPSQYMPAQQYQLLQHAYPHPQQMQMQRLMHPLPGVQHPQMYAQPMAPQAMQNPMQQQYAQYSPGTLLSQPYAHPTPVQHGQPATGYGVPTGARPVPPSYGLVPMGRAPTQGQPTSLPKTTRKLRDKKEGATVGNPESPAPTPPYSPRTKPAEPEKVFKRQYRGNNKPSRLVKRRQAGADAFPWNRDIDFPAARKAAMWDDTIYDASTLDKMKRVRETNISKLEKVDARLQEQQPRNKKKAAKAEDLNGADAEPSSDLEEKSKKGKKRIQTKNDVEDVPQSGGFTWADHASKSLAKDLALSHVDDAIEAGLQDKLSDNTMNKLRISWNPGKKDERGLEMAVFSVRDSVRTRRQLDQTPALTRRAAECLCDFCPDLLWRGILLRVCSEGGYGNKDVRDRFCYNGCYCDKATITKRISAALGQKQVQPKSRGYTPGEFAWYEANVKDFTHYIDYFGVRTGHRNMLKIQTEGDKSRAKREAMAAEFGLDGDGDGGHGVGGSPNAGPSKRRKLTADSAHGVVTGDETESAEDGEDGSTEAFEEDDAVSAQDSDILDEISDDEGK